MNTDQKKFPQNFCMQQKFVKLATVQRDNLIGYFWYDLMSFFLSESELNAYVEGLRTKIKSERLFDLIQVSFKFKPNERIKKECLLEHQYFLLGKHSTINLTILKATKLRVTLKAWVLNLWSPIHLYSATANADFYVEWLPMILQKNQLLI